MERFNFKKLSDTEVKEQYQVKNSNRFAALDNLDNGNGLPTYNLLKDENGDLLADSHSILNRWKNYFCQLLNVHDIMILGRHICI
jgi:hypothetical protein